MIFLRIKLPNFKVFSACMMRACMMHPARTGACKGTSRGGVLVLDGVNTPLGGVWIKHWPWRRFALFECSPFSVIFVVVDYVRTGAAFAIIALLLSAGAIFFTWYSINEPRYMFKRVAGSLHLITGTLLAFDRESK